MILGDVAAAGFLKRRTVSSARNRRNECLGRHLRLDGYGLGAQIDSHRSVRIDGLYSLFYGTDAVTAGHVRNVEMIHWKSPINVTDAMWGFQQWEGQEPSDFFMEIVFTNLWLAWIARHSAKPAGPSQ
jgi:hypothetical protein